ncbi:MAG: SAP domain-containing protein [Planctomycetota bacterium]
MKSSELGKKAKPFGIKADNMSKMDLIHAIQHAEGNTPCFGTSNGQCPYTDCCFMEDCLKIKCCPV